MKKPIAFFDFDGTITTKDTLLEFIKYSKGVLPFYIGFLLNSPYLVAYKLKLIPNQRAKEKVLQYFFAKMPLAQFQDLCDKFSETEIPKLLRPGAIDEINRLKAQQAEIVIVSASPANWIKKWATGMGADLIATELQVSGGCLTGFIVGKNCHGQEKVSRITKTFNLPDFSEIYAYGDSSGDKPMLSLASSAHYKPFRG